MKVTVWSARMGTLSYCTSVFFCRAEVDAEAQEAEAQAQQRQARRAQLTALRQAMQEQARKNRLEQHNALQATANGTSSMCAATA